VRDAAIGQRFQVAAIGAERSLYCIKAALDIAFSEVFRK